MPGTHSIRFTRSSNQRAVITDAAQTGLDLSSPFTLETWIKAVGEVGNADRWNICNKYDSGSNKRSYLWWFTEEGSSEYRNWVLVSETGAGTYDGLYCRPAQLSSNWHHYAVTYDQSLSMPDSFKFYVDGVLLTDKVITHDNSPTAIYNSDVDFEVGGNGYLGSNYAANFQLDELRVWSVVRSQSEIQGLMNSQAVGNEAGLVSCWHFDNNLLDANTTNGNDLTAVNGPTFVADDVGTLAHNGTLVDYEVYSGEFGAGACSGSGEPAVTPVPVPSPLETNDGGIVFGVRDTAARYSE